MSEPILDIVMLVSNQPTWADLAIRAVEHQTRNSYRLILVDQATTDPKMAEVLSGAKARGHTVLRMAENRSFSNGNNAGIRIGNSKFVCILNDDAMVTEGWDAAMIQDCSQKEVGLVGARTNYAAGPTGNPAWQGDAPFLTFVCVMMRREIFNLVGPMDEENFTGFSCEDLDYSWRIVKHGYKLKVSAGAYVLHAGSRSIVKYAAGAAGVVKGDANGAALAYNAHNEKYNRVLLEKWGKDWVAEHSKLKLKVLVVSYHAEEWTRVRFAGHLVMLKGGGASAASGGEGLDAEAYGFTYYQHVRTPIHLARQLVSDYALNQGYDVLIQLDDDSTFPPDLLRRLLAPQKEIVCALAYQRKPPYNTVCYELNEEQLKKGAVVSSQQLENIEHTGLRRVDVSGFHVSAIRLNVIRKMREFRSEKYPEGITHYWGGFDKAGEDFAFAAHCKEIGVPIHVDTDLISGHIGESITVDEGYKAKFKAGQAQ